MSVLALVPAAGDGVRLGVGVPKALVRLGGVPLVVRAVDGLVGSGVVDAVVVTAHPAHLEAVRELFVGCSVRVDVVAGHGPDRSSSVRVALDHGLRAYPDTHTVLVHDAARALTPPSLIAELVAAVAGEVKAVVPVLPLADTVKRIDDVGSVVSTLDRSVLRAVQTPQAFQASLLRRAYAASGAVASGAVASGDAASGDVVTHDTVTHDTVTDDAGLVERLGETVHTVPGDPLAFKITTAWDLRVAALLVGAR
ncbi:MAG: 2-C-methyl-D-erythritol 4-phosphate cytidylyltransferase [Actinomycetota bacterium]|nr:2-C-methyl-D-erythritol 4-phosphate cytidylyltransferase [Actinomycetota bacterium]